MYCTPYSVLRTPYSVRVDGLVDTVRLAGLSIMALLSYPRTLLRIGTQMCGLVSMVSMVGMEEITSYLSGTYVSVSYSYKVCLYGTVSVSHRSLYYVQSTT